ncbi:MAG TPA: type II toxin-antitoxin system VapC family toxin [Acidobacteriota bacterium]|nr:type II toxin-antitoxin system VapC family toxin [Acidobacteriota bacterium]
MIRVIDASVAVKWFIEEEAHPHADKILEMVVKSPQSFAVPELFAFEVFSVLHRLHPDGTMVFQKGIIPLLEGGMLRHPMTSDLALKAGHFVRAGLTGYDACYAALAEDIKGLWLTFDEKAHSILKSENISFCLRDSFPDP